jgi:copper chaperone CopZ
MKETLIIQNLKCGGCAHTITTRLDELDGISEVVVDNASHSVSFNYSESKDLERVQMLLSKLGYPVEGVSNSIGKKAKSLVSCAIGRMNN